MNEHGRKLAHAHIAAPAFSSRLDPFHPLAMN
jgi:hypothetical protein